MEQMLRKTNIIKFLYRFRRWVHNLDNRVGDDIPLYQPFKFDNATSDAPIGFSMEFITQKIRYKYEVSFTRTDRVRIADLLSKW